MYEEPQGHKRQIIAVLAVLIVIAVIVGGVVLAGDKDGDGDSAASTSSVSQSQTTNTASTTASSTTYKDGTYEATGSFGTPGGVNTIDVSVVVKDNAIQSVSATTNPPDRESEDYDQRFLAAYKTFVVGKDINQISLSRVSGASLTTQGFNSALRQIANEAKA